MPENEKLPLDYKNKSEFQKLLVIRALRPDRMVNALTQFISNQIGEKYTEDVVFSLQQTYEESTPTIALFFILSPGIDPVKSNHELQDQKKDTSMEKSVKKTLEEIIPNIPELYNRIENNYLAANIL